MNFKTGSSIALLIISIFLLSSCEVYQTLYGTQQSPTGNAVDTGTPEKETSEVATEETTETSEDTSEIEVTLPAEEVTTEEETTEVTEEAAPSEEVTTEEETTEVTEEITPTEEETAPKEKPVVIVVKETDLVNLVPKAEDPDKGTSLAFTFTSPLNENGEWQTTYGDNGEYTVTVTASDGELTTSRDVLIIIQKKEESPVIDMAKPIEGAIVIDETQAVDFSVQASDLNKDELTYTWKFDGKTVGDAEKYNFESTYDDSGTHTIKIEVSDGASSASKIWSVDIKNVNRKPILEQLSDITAKETDELMITATASDPDNDAIIFKIDDERFTQEDNVFKWMTDYDSAGIYDITISASDGQDKTEQTIKVNVGNVNRAPVITDIVLKK